MTNLNRSKEVGIRREWMDSQVLKEGIKFPIKVRQNENDEYQAALTHQEWDHYGEWGTAEEAINQVIWGRVYRITDARIPYPTENGTKYPPTVDTKVDGSDLMTNINNSNSKHIDKELEAAIGINDEMSIADKHRIMDEQVLKEGIEFKVKVRQNENGKYEAALPHQDWDYNGEADSPEEVVKDVLYGQVYDITDDRIPYTHVKQQTWSSEAEYNLWLSNS